MYDTHAMFLSLMSFLMDIYNMRIFLGQEESHQAGGVVREGG